MTVFRPMFGYLCLGAHAGAAPLWKRAVCLVQPCRQTQGCYSNVHDAGMQERQEYAAEAGVCSKDRSVQHRQPLLS